MRQFDSPKKSKKKGKSDNDVDVDGVHLAAALDRFEDELESGDESESIDNKVQPEEEGTDQSDDDEEEGGDGRDGMTQEEIKELEESVKPVRRVLTKVCRLSN